MSTPSDELLRELPKVELHCHIEGSARAATLAELAKKNGVELPSENVDELFAFTSLNQFLEVYGVLVESLKTADDYRRITYESLEDAAAAGVCYRETFFSPGFAKAYGVEVSTVWEGVKQGIADAEHDFDVTCRAILDFDKPRGVSHALEMVAFAASEPDRNLLIGVGADSVERGISHPAFAPAFEEAAKAGLRRTAHAGEDGPASNIRDCIVELGCERIDHGFALLDDEELTAMVVDRQIAMTACPTSNVVIAHIIDDVSEHPFDAQRARGVAVTLNSDDPGLMQFDLADEFAAVRDAFGYGLDDFEEITYTAIEASWAPDDEKQALRERVATAYQAAGDAA